MNLNYSINGTTFSSMGIGVTSSDGVLDGLTLKEPFTMNWPDSHGEVVDLVRPRFEVRKIELECFLIANTADAFQLQLMQLKAELMKPGTQRLMFNPSEVEKPLVFEVYCPSGFPIKKQWRNGKMVGQFTLKLTEPSPLKWVLRANGGSTFSFRLTAPTPITIHWGDGTKTVAMGTNQQYSHPYAGTISKFYYIIVTGELERMTVHERSSTLLEIWPRLF